VSDDAFENSIDRFEPIYLDPTAHLADKLSRHDGCNRDIRAKPSESIRNAGGFDFLTPL
jgi:hypothetical protein